MTLQSGKQSRTSLLLQVPCVCAGARVCYASSNICVATQQRAGRPTEAQTSFCRREARQLSSRAAFRLTSKCTHTRALAQAQEARSGNALMNLCGIRNGATVFCQFSWVLCERTPHKSLARPHHLDFGLFYGCFLHHPLASDFCEFCACEAFL